MASPIRLPVFSPKSAWERVTPAACGSREKSHAGAMMPVAMNIAEGHRHQEPLPKSASATYTSAEFEIQGRLLVGDHPETAAKERRHQEPLPKSVSATATPAPCAKQEKSPAGAHSPSGRENFPTQATSQPTPRTMKNAGLSMRTPAPETNSSKLLITRPWAASTMFRSQPSGTTPHSSLTSRPRSRTQKRCFKLSLKSRHEFVPPWATTSSSPGKC